MQLMQCRDYRPYLKGELELRVASNPRYSLRAFARDLSLSPQMLSYVLNGKKGISVEAAVEIADCLGLDPAEASYFVDLVTFVHSKSSKAKKLAEFRIEERQNSEPKFKSLEVEAFKAIADWHHYAILELSLTEDFKSDPKWISERLGTSTFEVTQALERLEKLELLESDKRGILRKTDLNISANYGVPSSALRKLAKQLLQKAIDSLESQSIEVRDVTNITMAIDPSLLPEAKKMITDFRRKLCKFLEQGNRTEVYSFAPALFRLTQPRKRK
jgi:uncharacterized protein (TIGR02147 family)